MNDVSSPYIYLLLRIRHDSWLRMKTWIYKCARLIVKLVFPGAGKRNTEIGKLQGYTRQHATLESIKKGVLEHVKVSPVFSLCSFVEENTVTSFSLGTNHPFGQKESQHE